MSIIIKNGELVKPNGIFRQDIKIDNGKIQAIGQSLPTLDAEVYDATGQLVFPGFIDAHTHLDMNNGVTVTVDNFASGTRSALAGGTTTIVDFATQKRGGTLQAALDEWHSKADGNSSCNYAFHMAITDCNSDTLHEISQMTAQGVTSYKVYMAYDALRLSDGQIYDVLRAVQAQGGIVGCHCENGDLVNKGIAQQLALHHTQPSAHPLSRPDILEAEAITRYLAIAKMANCPVNIVHVSSKKGLDILLCARAEGQPVFIETCPQYLLLDDTNYSRDNFEGAKYTISPPLRKQNDMLALWQAIKQGQIDTIATDHCAFNFHGQKELGRDDFSKIPNGAPGLETRPALLYTYGVLEHGIHPMLLAKLMAENPAKLFGMFPQKGVLAEGSDADIVIWDKSYNGIIQAQTQHNTCDYTPYEGFRAVGRPSTVFLNGVPVVKDGELLQENCGTYVPRSTCSLFR